jgi:hypothetical protein
MDQINGFFAITDAQKRVSKQSVIELIEGFQKAFLMVFLYVVCLPNSRHVETIIREDGGKAEVFHSFPQPKKTDA